jgi:hypothetical protein
MADATEEAPMPTGLTQDVSLTGLLFPWTGDFPVMLAMPGSDYSYLPVFTVEEKLLDFMFRAGVAYMSIKKIEDGPEFLQSIYENPAMWTVRVILDPYYLSNRRIRFLQVLSG